MHGDALADYFPCSPWMPAPDPCVLVTLPGGIELAADPGRSHAEFSLSGWSGWDEGPEVTGGAIPWENSDGGIEGDVILQGRNLAFNGLIQGRSPAHYWELRHELGAVLTSTRWGVLRVDEAHMGLARQVRVARGARPVFGSPLSDRIGEYQLQLQTASHVLTDVDEQSVVVTSAGVDLTNYGNARADLLIKMQGQLLTPGLDWSGGHWTFDASVGAGKLIEADLTNRKVSAPDTGIHYRQYAKGTWLRLPPGTTRVRRTGTGAGTVTAVWRSAWS